MHNYCMVGKHGDIFVNINFLYYLMGMGVETIKEGSAGLCMDVGDSWVG